MLQAAAAAAAAFCSLLPILPQSRREGGRQAATQTFRLPQANKRPKVGVGRGAL